MKKSDGRRVQHLSIPKLDDANMAGGSRSGECTLILTEGDSAKALAISGLSVVGRDRYGVFPLKGVHRTYYATRGSAEPLRCPHLSDRTGGRILSASFICAVSCMCVSHFVRYYCCIVVRDLGRAVE